VEAEVGAATGMEYQSRIESSVSLAKPLVAVQGWYKK
jgi:hypothetical protein